MFSRDDVLALMEMVSVGSDWTVLLAGFVVTGIGIGLANPTIAGAALRVVDPARTGSQGDISPATLLSSCLSASFGPKSTS